MARAARDPRRQAPRLGLLILATACAAAQEPPGGPPDFSPPVLLAITPDSGAILPGFKDRVVFAFDEVINERSAPNLADLFVVSPRPKEIRVSWKRSRLEVRPKDGWRANAVYRVVLLPGVADLRNNRLSTGAEVVFSTGPPIPDTRVTATVVDWAAGRVARQALLEAYPVPIDEDSTAYIAKSDSTGAMVLTHVPPGRYLLVGTVDQNGNRRRDRREAFDSTTVQIDSVLDEDLWAFVADTVGPAVRDARRVDSVTARVTFTQSLRPGPPDADAVSALLLPDSTPVAVARVLTPPAYDSLLKREAAERDSLARAAADTTARADTTAPRDTTRAVSAAPADTGRAAADTGQAEPDTSRTAALLRERPPLFDELIVRFVAPLIPGARYLVTARVANVAGAVADARGVLAIPDTTEAPPRP